MLFSFPPAVKIIIDTLTKAGFTCEIVGGAVRDLLLQKASTDWDFATNAKPEEILPLFKESFYENNFGTVMVALKHLKEQFDFDEPSLTSPLPEGDSSSTSLLSEGGQEGGDDDLIFDITTYRSDGLYRNSRHPENVTWGKNIEEDLKRRDFTINAMALKVVSDQWSVTSKKSTEHRPPNTDHQLIDPFDGKKDLQEKLIRCVGNAEERFAEDALRMLRAVRFAAQLGFEIEAKTREAISHQSYLLAKISWERISQEFMKMLGNDNPDKAIRDLDEMGLLSLILPELIETKGIKQSGHHIYDVWEHSIRALESCPSSDPVVRLATLLHDIAKPQTARVTPKGTVTFYGHEVVGARVAKKIAGRLRLSKSDCDRIFTLVRWHMFTYEKHVTDAYIRRFIRRVGLEQIGDMMDLRTGDRVGSGSKASSWRLEELKQRIHNELHQPLKVTDLVVDGNDIMKELKIKPGPIIGKILNTLFEDVLENPEHNTREYLLKKMNEIYSNL